MYSSNFFCVVLDMYLDSTLNKNWSYHQDSKQMTFSMSITWHKDQANILVSSENILEDTVRVVVIQVMLDSEDDGDEEEYFV